MSLRRNATPKPQPWRRHKPRPGRKTARAPLSTAECAPTHPHPQARSAARGLYTPVWMGPIRPLIVSEIENFERKEWKILSHDHISPYLTGTCDVVIRRTTRASRQRKPHRDRAISGPKRPARIARSQEPPSETLRKFAHKRGTYVC